MKTSRPWSAAALFLVVLIAFPLEAAESPGGNNDRCDALFIGCVAGSALISATDWPADFLSFADLFPGCAMSYLWCKIYFG